MYGQDPFLTANPLGRDGLEDRNPLKYNADGSLDLYLQNQSPGPDKEANWLPAPADDFNVTLRLDWHKKAVLDGTWTPPPIKRVELRSLTATEAPHLKNPKVGRLSLAASTVSKGDLRMFKISFVLMVAVVGLVVA